MCCMNLHVFIQPNGNDEHMYLTCDEQPAQKNLLINCWAMFSSCKCFCMGYTGYGKVEEGFSGVFLGGSCLFFCLFFSLKSPVLDNLPCVP